MLNLKGSKVLMALIVQKSNIDHVWVKTLRYIYLNFKAFKFDLWIRYENISFIHLF